MSYVDHLSLNCSQCSAKTGGLLFKIYITHNATLCDITGGSLTEYMQLLLEL